jgi:hypothetical protein
MAFADPEMMLSEYMDEIGQKWAFEEFIVEQMEKYKTQAVKRFYIVSDPQYAELVAVTTAYGFEQGLTEAKKIVDELRLTDKHLAALNDDARAMNEILSQESYEDNKYSKWIGA